MTYHVPSLLLLVCLVGCGPGDPGGSGSGSDSQSTSATATDSASSGSTSVTSATTSTTGPGTDSNGMVCDPFFDEAAGVEVNLVLRNARTEPIYVVSQTSCSGNWFGLTGPAPGLRWPIDGCGLPTCETMMTGDCPICDCAAGVEMLAPGASLESKFYGHVFADAVLPAECGVSDGVCPAGDCRLAKTATPGSYELSATAMAACDPEMQGPEACDCMPGTASCPLFSPGTLSGETIAAETFAYPDTTTVTLTFD